MGDALTYRRRRGHHIWHFCSNCAHWPAEGFDELDVRPKVGELCVECRAKEGAGICEEPVATTDGR